MKIKYLLFIGLVSISLSLVAEKQNYFTIIINSYDTELSQLDLITDIGAKKRGKYKKIYIEQYAIVRNSAGYSTTFLFDEPQKFKASKFEKLKIRSNQDYIKEGSCTAVASGVVKEIYGQLMEKIAQDPERFSYDNGTEVVVFDPFRSIKRDKDIAIFYTLSDLKLYLSELMRLNAKILLIYNNFTENDLDVKINEPYHDNNDFFIPACLTKEDADRKDYYYPIKWALPDLCGISTEISFFDNEHNEIYNVEFNENKNAKGDTYFWQKNGNEYCFFIRVDYMWQKMMDAYNLYENTDLWDNTDAYIFFEVETNSFGKTSKSERVKFFVNCHLEIYRNVNCDCE